MKFSETKTKWVAIALFYMIAVVTRAVIHNLPHTRHIRERYLTIDPHKHEDSIVPNFNNRQLEIIRTNTTFF